MDVREDIKLVISRYPSLKYNSERHELSGQLYISEHDSYELEIVLSPYPQHFPIIFEVGDRIPKKANRHIYTDTGSLCFTTRAKAQILLNTKTKTLSDFIKYIVIPYLQNNSYFEINSHYKTEEYSHNSLGVIEGYKDILQIDNELQIAQLMLNRIEGKKVKIHHNCYCGSGIKHKNCLKGLHDKCYRDFKKIEKEVLKSDLMNYFIPLLEKKQGLRV